MKQRTVRPPHLSGSVKRFIESVGTFIHYWGFMKLQGEIWALTFISKKPLTAREVAKLLGVSKASVSLALKDLLDYQVISFSKSSGKRNLPILCNENLPEVICGVLRTRETKMLQRTRAEIKALLASSSHGLEMDETRLIQVETLVETAEALLQTFVGLPATTKKPRV